MPKQINHEIFTLNGEVFNDPIISVVFPNCSNIKPSIGFIVSVALDEKGEIIEIDGKMMENITYGKIGKL